MKRAGRRWGGGEESGEEVGGGVKRAGRRWGGGEESGEEVGGV